MHSKPDHFQRSTSFAIVYSFQDDATGLVELDIDLGVLSLPRAPPLATKLLGPDWRASLSRHARPPDVAHRHTLTLADYKQRQGIA